MNDVIPWKVVCHRCLSRARNRGESEAWCSVCHAEVVAAMNANLAMPARCIGQPHYSGASSRSWQVVWARKNKLRIRLVTGSAEGLIPLELEMAR